MGEGILTAGFPETDRIIGLYVEQARLSTTLGYVVVALLLGIIPLLLGLGVWVRKRGGHPIGKGEAATWILVLVVVLFSGGYVLWNVKTNLEKMNTYVVAYMKETETNIRTIRDKNIEMEKKLVRILGTLGIKE